MNTTITRGDFTFTVPALDIDKGRGIGPNGRVERRIVAALIQHMAKRGFRVSSVWDGEERTTVGRDFASIADVAAYAMEAIFNLDEASLRFMLAALPDEQPEANEPNRFTPSEHGVLLILGNGVDVVSDWNFYSDDHDGFNAAMNAFDAEAFA
jgi:hypothetical protein